MGLPRLGLIGVGLMGHGIATNLLAAGYSLTFQEHPGNQPTESLLAAGAEAVDTPAAVTQASDVVILCVTGSPEVAAVLNGDAGVTAALRPGQTVIDCSTAIPDETLKNARAIAAAGADFLDAPMTRTPKEAAEGRLNLIVGGEQAVFDACRPVFDAIAENVYHAGGVGAGHAMKLLHNFVSLGFSAVLAEAAACAADKGIDAGVLVKILGEGGGGGVVLDRLAPFITDGDIAGFRFSIANAAKDLGYYVDMADAMGAERSIAGAISDRYAEAALESDALTPLPELIPWLRRQPD